MALFFDCLFVLFYSVLFCSILSYSILFFLGIYSGFKNWNRELLLKYGDLRDLQDGRGVRSRDHLPLHKYIRNTSTCRIAPTEHQLNAGRRPQTSQKARKLPMYLGRANKKGKNRDKRVGMGSAPLVGSYEGGNVSTH